MKSKNILFKDKIGEYLYNFGIGEDFLNKSPIGWEGYHILLTCGCQGLLVGHLSLEGAVVICEFSQVY